MPSPGYPACLPSWISDWAKDCTQLDKSTLSSDDPRYFPMLELSGFQRMLSAPCVASALKKLCGDEGSDTCRDQVKTLLSEVCSGFHKSKLILVETPADARVQLRAIAKSADRLAKSIKEQKQLLLVPTNLQYLAKRASSDQLTSFMARHRGGLHAASYATPVKVTLVELLEVFAADIREELSDSPRRVNSLDGGADAPIRYQIRWLKRIYRSLFGRPNSAMISHLLTAINDKEVSSSRVTKVTI